MSDAGPTQIDGLRHVIYVSSFTKLIGPELTRFLTDSVRSAA